MNINIQVDDDDYLMSLAPQSLLVVGKALVTYPTPENIFDRLLTLLRESSGASSVYNEVTICPKLYFDNCTKLAHL